MRGNYNVIIVDESVGSDSLRGHEFVQVRPFIVPLYLYRPYVAPI